MQAFHSFVLIVIAIAASETIAQQTSFVRFDVPSIAIAHTVQPEAGTFVPEGYRRVHFQLNVSSLIDTIGQTQPHELQYQLRLNDRKSRVVDYSPRTRLQDRTNGGVQVEQIDEQSSNVGIHLKGSYQAILQADAGSDQVTKQIQKRKYQQITQRDIVYASGTLQRGQGVYFQMRHTPQHVLDGEKTFSVTLQVPNAWRGDMIDLRLSAIERVRNFPAIESESKVTSFARYQVAVVNSEDTLAQRWAQETGMAEQNLRETAAKYAGRIRERSAPTIFHHVAIALEVMQPKISEDWLNRVLFEQIDPYFDEQIRQLPVDVKVAVFDYLEARSKYQAYVSYEHLVAEASSRSPINPIDL